LKINFLLSGDNVFVNCEYGIAFNCAKTWDNCVQLPVICSGFELSRDNCAHLHRFECLLPHKVTA